MKVRPQRRRRGEAAMTLLDCMMAIGLLTIGSAGLLAVEMVGISMGAHARNLEQATRLGSEQMEILSYATTAPPSGSDSVDGAGCNGVRCTQIGQIFQRTWTVGAGSPVQLEVQVQWTDGQGQAHRVVLSGLR